MALDEIRAAFTCDGCGVPFSVQVDPAGVPPAGWSAFDHAEDAVRGSLGYEGPKTPEGFVGMSSVQDGRHLCGWCTNEADRKGERP
jgi:hypothetical protein